jgi:hypothetical protein
MGQVQTRCDGPETRPYTFSLNELIDLKIGERKQMNQGCGSLTFNIENELKSKGFGWPNNGEFAWGDRGDSCALCAGEYGCSCEGGIAGSRGTVKRIAYTGDPTKCCLANHASRGSVKSVEGRTCDPLNTDPSSQTCTNAFRTYCKEGNNIFEDIKCKNLSKTNQTLFNQLMKDTCNSSDELAESSGCIDWCQSNARECTRLTTLKDCIKYGITKSECTSEKVAEVRTACIKGGILSEQGLSTGWQCNPNALLKLDETCATYNISKDTCTPIQIAEAEANELQKELAAKALEESNKKYLATQKAISDILGEDIQPMIEGTDSTTTKVDFVKENKGVIVIIYLLIILLIISSMIVL